MAQWKLVRERRFLPLLGTVFWGALNDNLLKNGLVFLVTYQAVSVLGLSPGQLIAFASALFVLPFVLLSPLAGQIADKYEKASLIRGLKLFEVFLMALAAWALVTESFGVVLILLFCMGAQSTLYGPIKYAYLPQRLGPTELVGGNALVQSTTFLAILLGTVASAFVRINEHGVALVSVALVLFALVGFVSSLFIPKTPANNDTLTLSFNPFRVLSRMWVQSFRRRPIFLTILAISWFWFFGAVVMVLLPEYSKHFLQVNEWVLALFLLTFTVGVAAGSLACDRLSRQRLEVGIVPLGSFGMAFFFLLLGVWQPPAAREGELLGVLEFIQSVSGVGILASLFFLAVFSGFYIVPLQTFIQSRGPKAELSQILAFNNIMNAFFMVIGSVFLFVMYSFQVSFHSIMFLMVIFTLVVSSLIYRQMPEFFYRFIMWVLSTLLYRVKVSGYENIPEKSPALLVCNHVSFVDWLLIGGAIKRPIRFVMINSYYKGWFIKWLMKEAGVIPIASKRTHPEVFEGAFQSIADALRNGELVCIFPEGRLTADGQLNRFRPGVEKALSATPVNTIPMGLRNLWGSFFTHEGSGPLRKWPKKLWARIELVVGEAVPATEASADALQLKVQELVEREFEWEPTTPSYFDESKTSS